MIQDSVVSCISGVSIEQLAWAIVPYFAGLIVLLIAKIYIPAISLTLLALW